MRVLLIRRMMRAARLNPMLRIDLGEKGICFKGSVDPRKFNACGKGKGLSVDFSPSDNKDLIVLRNRLQGSFQRIDHLTVFTSHFIGLVPGYDDMHPVGQRSGKGVKGLATHNHGVPRSFLLKMLKIIGQVPGQVPVISELIGFSGSRNQD